MADRAGVRYPKFREQFSVLDFSEDRELFSISLYPTPAPLAKEKVTISVCGADCKIKTLGWSDLQSLPKIKSSTTPLICQIFNCAVEVVWEGWELATVLDYLGMSAKENRHYAFYSRDAMYFESLSHREATDERAILARGLNGRDLPHEHGGPVRLVVPFLQGYKSVKWLSGIRSFKVDPLGIKILLEQSKTGKLSVAWKRKYGFNGCDKEGRPWCARRRLTRIFPPPWSYFIAIRTPALHSVD